MPIIKNIGQLKAALKGLPDNMPVEGYDGSDESCLVSAYVNDYEDVEEKNKPPTFIIDVD